MHSWSRIQNIAYVNVIVIRKLLHTLTYTWEVRERERETTLYACAHVVVFEESEIDWEAGRFLETMTTRAYIV